MKLQDLKRGMRCTFRNGIKFIYNDHDDEYIYYLGKGSDYCKKVGSCRENLKHKRDKGFDIVRVDDVTLNGYKTIWKRQEPELYTLSLPNCSFKNRYLEISLEDNTRYRFKRKPKHNKPHVVKDYLDNKVVETYISVFTDEDIRNISNSKLINLLNKEVFEEEREDE